jgi:broad specificity phosphatase PhoE
MRELEQLIFCRHGETESNAGGWLAGWLDGELTARGWAQAAQAAERLRGERVAAIYASPLRRARETAEVIAATLGLPVVTVDGLQERHWGELEGGAFPGDLTRQKVPGGESLTAFEARVVAALRRIPVPEPQAGLPLIVAHAGTGYALQKHFGLEAGYLIDNAVPIRLARREVLADC